MLHLALYAEQISILLVGPRHSIFKGQQKPFLLTVKELQADIP